MITIDVNEMQRDFPANMRRVNSGETLLILEEGTPIAELKPVAQISHKLRPYGLCAAEFIVPDNFDDPLPEDILSGFEGA